MEDEIEKLVSEYRQRINQIELQLEHVGFVIGQSRRNGEDYSAGRLEQARLNTKMTMCQQAKAAFESLLDYI